MYRWAVRCGRSVMGGEGVDWAKASQPAGCHVSVDGLDAGQVWRLLHGAVGGAAAH